MTGGGLPPGIDAAFEAWITAAVARYVPPLAFPEVRKGVQALSALYVERRRAGHLGERASDGLGKRAALATFYAPLHFLLAYTAAALSAAGGRAPRRIVDLGCGSGAAGAGAALALATPVGPAPELLGLDASGWALGEARHTWRAFGLRGRARRARLPGALPRVGAGDFLVLGWFANELDPAAREALLSALAAARAQGSGLLLLEPLARGAAPWWDAAAAQLSQFGVESGELKIEPVRPAWIERLDRAAGLDHRTIGARILSGPCA